MKTNHIISIAIISAITIACNNPKVIEGQSTSSSGEASGIFSEENNSPANSEAASTAFSDNIHTVVVNEVLQASRYVYLKVTEGGEQFWIATGKKEIKVGDTYFYKGGLLKTNFESKEHNKVFDKIYLVTNLVPRDHGDNKDTGTLTESKTIQKEQSETKTNIPTHTDEIVRHKGSVKIAEIVANPKSYAGKTVQITGKCVKVNPGIMDRNWIHLQDGTKDDYDLVVTSDTFVPVGKVVTIKALVSLNRDFGAGYSYALILENGIVIE
jgi:hypothetical protein